MTSVLLHQQSASALTAALRRREVGSRELLEHYLNRIETLNPALKAVVTLDAERARQRADAADAATARGESWGPLHGLPMTIKDLFETAGMRTTAGMIPHYVPARHAEAVQRLEDAGAVIFGKTNVSVLGKDVQSYNPIFGACNNPWDLARSAGGSSGGAAAALAAGLTPLELGSDLAGSIRIPAHFCGVYGHRPSHGLVSLRGHIPGPPGCLSEPDLATVGPMARDAADLALALDVLVGPVAEKATAWRVELPPPRQSDARRLRVAAWLDDPECPLDAALMARQQRMVECLRAAGVAVDTEARPALAFAEAHRLYVNLLLSATSPALPPEMFAALEEQARLGGDEANLALGYARGTTLRHRDWLLFNEARLKLRALWAEFFRDYDVLLCPVAPTTAIAHDHSEPLFARQISVNGAPRSYLELMSWTGIIGAVHLPVTVTPIGTTAQGLPAGIQIVGPYLEDKTPIAFAGLLGEVMGGVAAPPGY